MLDARPQPKDPPVATAEPVGSPAAAPLREESNDMSASASDIALSPLHPPAARAEEAVHETVIQPTRGWIAVDWREMARQRELLYFLVWRDVKVRYKQAVLGVAWAVLQPVAQVVIFSAIFGAGFNLARMLGANVGFPYALYVFAALLPWQFFQRSLNDGGLSLVNQQHLLTKTYFPRLFVPTSSVMSALFDMMVSLPVFAVTMAVFGFVPPWQVVFLPLLLVPTALFAAGIAYLLAALTITYRDFRFIIPFLAQLWMWVSFVMLPMPDNWLHRPLGKLLMYGNPMYGFVATYRKIFLDFDRGWSPWMLVTSCAASVVMFVVGIFYFRRTERRFADIA